MIRLIKMHLGLLKLLFVELTKKTTVKVKVEFLKKLYPQYIIQIKAEYKNFINLFDKEYRKKLVEYKKYQQVQKDLVRIIKLMNYINHDLLIKMGKEKKERQQIRRDFIENGRLDKEVFDVLMKEVG